MNNKKVLTTLSIFFILISSTIYFLLEFEKEDKIKKAMDTQLKLYTTSYNSIYHQYKERANLIFDTKVNKLEVLNVLKDINGSNQIQKDKIRDELYHMLKGDYENLKKYYVKQLHFHLPNNDSFLRFHRPQKYGDNLSEARATVKYVNENKKYINGFEEGRIYNGYRFVYPLFFENKHIGSVEISFDTSAILYEFIEHFNTSVKFLISKNVVDKKVMEDEHDNYMESNFKGFYFEKSVYEKVSKRKDYKIISDESSSFIAQKIGLGENFTKYDKKTKKLVIIIPLKNPVTKKVVASVLIKGNSKYIQNKTLNFQVVNSTLIFLFGIIFTVIYFELTTKQKLKENTKKLEAVIQEADSGIAIMDLKGNFLEVNHVYTELLGYTSEEFKRLNCSDLAEEEFRFLSEGVLEEAKISGSVSKIRKTCIAKDNSKVHLEMSLNLLPNKSSFVAIVNSLKDKIELENTLNKFEHIFNYTSVGFLVVDKKRDIIDINQKFLKMFGYSRKSQLIGKNASIVHIDKEHYESFGELVFSKALLNEILSVEFEFKKRDGTSIWCEISGSPINDNNKLENGGVLWAATDISEKVNARKMIEEQNKKLQQLNKNLNNEVELQIEKIREKDIILNQQAKMASMGEMIDAVAHQWKQPLNIIKLSTDELEYMVKDKAIDTVYLDELGLRVRNQVNHMVETLDEFREFFRPKSNLESISIKRIIDSALVLMKDELVKHTIVTKFIGDESIKVNIVPNEFKHVIINLVNNAKDEFVSKEIKVRTIIFDVIKEDVFVVLKVTDTAGGIPKYILDDIFKANVSTKSEGKGTGIGLYMTKNIIEKIGGSIAVKNTQNGAEFIIRIPV